MDTQTNKILKILRTTKGGIPNYRFPQMGILRYSARIASLRREGHNIIAVRQEVHGKLTGVWVYYLMEEKLEDYPLEYEESKKKDLFKGFKQLFKKGRIAS